ncbi:putative bifunctional diguanylate cyclase/phosphodiesterase [Alteromonas facilis]|uniref:putative bifunctional diguanylate cyclase/phosphodiesterase n=1 Tax=Alteromonas facilis TaxID=2048004 RepID=UPI000C292BF2|nr:EAL domain-containing protein [Alteromonas facilis]
MINRFLNRCVSLRTKLLVSFLTIVVIVTTITLYIVQSATYRHSTGVLQNYAEVARTVIHEQLIDASNALQGGATTLADDFSIKKLIIEAPSDPASLALAMDNFSQRFNADGHAVLSIDGDVLSASNGLHGIVKEDIETIAQEGTTWLSVGGRVFLAKAAPVKNTPRSRTPMAWLIFTKSIDSLMGENLTRLTSMDVSFLRAQQGGTTFLASSYSSDIQREFMRADLTPMSTLTDSYLPSAHYIYLVSPIGVGDGLNILLMLSTVEENAYLSYNTLLGRLFGLLIVVASIALLSAILIANGITNPIQKLVTMTQKIRNGETVKHFPRQSTTEVNTLSSAISSMQQGIAAREQEINRLAFYDSVTQLPNRNNFIQQLERQIESHPNQRFSVVLLDINRFKEINDTIGHVAGDELLKLVGERLQRGWRGNLFIARLSGDEFAVIDTQNDNTESLMSALLNLFNSPFLLDKLSLDINVSIGGATYDDHGRTPSELMQAADIALHHSKASHHKYVLYSPSLNTFSIQRLRLMSELKDALTTGQLILYYQPKLLLESEQISAVECLIRWIHPEHGFIPPDEFIPLAEQTGAIKYVTQWALRQACQQYDAWRKEGLDIAMAVNISALDLTDLSLPYMVSTLLNEFEMKPERLILEVTESAVMADPKMAVNALTMLSRMGIKLSIDDFGTGFSSLAQLKQMPVDELKIDKAFVLELASNNDDQTMVRTIIAMAKNLGLSTVAEGVEDQQSIGLLQQMGCTTAQGFHISKPRPSEELTPWLHEQNCTRYQGE